MGHHGISTISKCRTGVKVNELHCLGRRFQMQIHVKHDIFRPQSGLCKRFCLVIMVSACFCCTCDLLMPNHTVFFDVLSGDGGTFLTHLLYIKTVTDLHRTWLPRLISRWMMLFACKCPALLRVFFSHELVECLRVVWTKMGGNLWKSALSQEWFTKSCHTAPSAYRGQNLPDDSFTPQQSVKRKRAALTWTMYRVNSNHVKSLVGIYVGMPPRVVLTPTVYYKLT